MSSATPSQIDKLLDRLGSDNQFREKMLGDPVSALAEHGLEVKPEEIPAVRRLPSKDALLAQRGKIKESMAHAPCLIFFAQTS